MLDKQRINFIIEDIKTYLSKLEKMKIKTINDLNEDVVFFASSMISFQILNRMIDLGDDIIRGKNLGYPLETKDTFTILEKEKIIDEKMSKKMKELVRMRNKFAHRYGNIERQEIYNFIESGKEIINLFIDKIIRYIKNEKSN